ncbi:MAG TPA: DUF1778 domain-containing protein [Thiopseudomonas sp.]|nr:DUF1778 domain-containing protein [Thiopseudomonas sp.]
MATARLNIRLNEEIKAKSEKTSALLGLKSLTEYVVRPMDEDTSQVIAQHESMTIEEKVFDRFMAVCDQAQASNKEDNIRTPDTEARRAVGRTSEKRDSREQNYFREAPDCEKGTSRKVNHMSVLSY